jgi:cell division transport system permease protein
VSSARTGGASPMPAWRAWMWHHRQSATDSLTRLLVAPLSSLLTCLAIGVALALPAVLLLALSNVSQVVDRFDDPARLSVLLSEDTDAATAQRVRDRLAQRSELATVIWIDRDAALATFADDLGLSSLLSQLENNPLPHTLALTPRYELSAAALEVLAADIAREAEVAEVVLDSRWLARFTAILAVAERVIWLIGGLTGLGAILVLGNIVHLGVEARRAEIVVVKLIGGSPHYARRPFLYTGLWLGVGGGLLSVIMVLGVTLWLDPVLRPLAALYDSDWVFRPLTLVQAAQLMLIGGALGLASAWQSASRHLYQIEPH